MFLRDLVVPPSESWRTQLDTFWRWRDRPRAGRGLEYQRAVTVWKLDWLPDTGAYLFQDEEGGR